MSEKEKRIIEKLKEAIPNMSEFDKGWPCGDSARRKIFRYMG